MGSSSLTRDWTWTPCIGSTEHSNIILKKIFFFRIYLSLKDHAAWPWWMACRGRTRPAWWNRKVLGFGLRRWEARFQPQDSGPTLILPIVKLFACSMKSSSSVTFMVVLLCAGPCSKHFTCIISFNLYNSFMMRELNNAPNSHIKWHSWGLNPASQTHAFQAWKLSWRASG